MGKELDRLDAIYANAGVDMSKFDSGFKIEEEEEEPKKKSFLGEAWGATKKIVGGIGSAIAGKIKKEYGEEKELLKKESFAESAKRYGKGILFAPPKLVKGTVELAAKVPGWAANQAVSAFLSGVEQYNKATGNKLPTEYKPGVTGNKLADTIQKFFQGEDAIKSFQQRYKESVPQAESLGFTGDKAKTIAISGVALSTLLDVTGFGMGKKQFAKKILKISLSQDEKIIANELKAILKKTHSDDEIKNLANQLKDVSDKKQVEELLAKEMQVKNMERQLAKEEVKPVVEPIVEPTIKPSIIARATKNKFPIKEGDKITYGGKEVEVTGVFDNWKGEKKIRIWDDTEKKMKTVDAKEVIKSTEEVIPEAIREVKVPKEVNRMPAGENIKIMPAAKKATGVSEVKLPFDLRGAKPRYGYGNKLFELNFENDLDKAAYILAQKTPSKRDADYLKFVMENTGKTEKEARELGQEIKNKIKDIAKVSDESVINFKTSSIISEKVIISNALKSREARLKGEGWVAPVKPFPSPKTLKEPVEKAVKKTEVVISTPVKAEKLIPKIGKEIEKATGIKTTGVVEAVKSGEVTAESFIKTFRDKAKGMIKSIIEKTKKGEDIKGEMSVDRVQEAMRDLKNYPLDDEVKERVYKESVEYVDMIKDMEGRPFTNKLIKEIAPLVDDLKSAPTIEKTYEIASRVAKTAQSVSTRINSGEEITEELLEKISFVKKTKEHTGRLLQSFKTKLPIEMSEVAVSDLKNVKANEIKEAILFELAGGIEKGKYLVDDVLKDINKVDWNDMRKVTEFYRKFEKASFRDILTEYRYANLLSSPLTHLVNTFSNLLQIGFLAPAQKLYHGGVDMIASGLFKQERKVWAKSVPDYYKGLYNSWGKAVKELQGALQGKTLIERPDISMIPTGRLKGFRAIPNLLNGMDVFFRTLATGGEMNVRAKNALLSGKKLTPELLAKISKESEDAAAKWIFREALDPENKTGQGAILAAIDNITSKVIYPLREHVKFTLKIKGNDVVFRPAAWFIPFVQTPMNILKQGIEYSPLGFSTLAGSTRKAEQLSKALLGSTVFAGAGFLAFSGNTTWDVPTNPQERAAFYASGRKPYSIKIGDKWVSYSKLGPLAYPIAMASAVQWYWKENPQAQTETTARKILNIMEGMAQFFSDQSYVQGLGDMVDIVTGKPQAMSSAIISYPKQLIPLSSLQRWVTQLIDPVYRKTDKDISFISIGENLAKDIPFLSKGLPAYEGLEGEPSKRSRGSSFSPLQFSKISPEGEKGLQTYRESQRLRAVSSKVSDDFNERAENLYDELESLKQKDPELVNERWKEIVADDKELAKKIKTIKKDADLGLTFSDRTIKNLGVANGDRAKMIHSQMQRLKTEEDRKSLWSDYVKKKIITKEVAKQLKQLRKSKE